jgi:hypothetical protein
MRTRAIVNSIQIEAIGFLYRKRVLSERQIARQLLSTQNQPHGGRWVSVEQKNGSRPERTRNTWKKRVL